MEYKDIKPGIRGWLLVIFVFFSISLVYNTLYIIFRLLPNRHLPEAILQRLPNQSMYPAFWSYEVICNIVGVLLTALILYLIVKKSESAVRWVYIFLVVDVIGVAVERIFMAAVFHVNDFSDVFTSLLVAAVVALYFSKSQRVEVTLIH